jgi:hypothetical protein
MGESLCIETMNGVDFLGVRDTLGKLLCAGALYMSAEE